LLTRIGPIAAVWLVLAGAAAAQPRIEAGQGSIANSKDVLRQRVPRLDFQKLPLDQVLAAVGGLCPPLRLVPLWEVLQEVGVTPQTPVTAALRDTTLRDALYAVLDGVAAREPLDFYVQNGTIVVTTRADGDRRFARIMLAEARAFAMGLERATALAKRLTAARAAPSADAGAVAALARDLRETAEPLLPEVDFKAWRLKELDADLATRYAPTGPRRQAVADYLRALDGVLDWLLVPGVFSEAARPASGLRAVAFRRTEAVRPGLEARLRNPASAGGASGPPAAWTVLGDRLSAQGAGTAWLALETDAPADVEVMADLALRGPARALSIFLDFAGRDGPFEHSVWCTIYLAEVPNRFTVGHDGAPHGQNQTTHVPAVRPGRPRRLRLVREAERFIAAVGEQRSVATPCPRLPAGARLRQVVVQAATDGEALTLEPFRIVCPQDAR
jgi:hypothetical protein